VKQRVWVWFGLVGIAVVLSNDVWLGASDFPKRHTSDAQAQPWI